LILGFAAGSAVLAAMLARGFLSPPPPERQVVEVSKVATGDVLVAAADLPLGDKLTPANVAWHRWPKDAITPQMITREAKPNAPAELADARLRAPIFKGEPIGERKLVMPNSSGFMAAVLPKGMRAISVAITAETGAGGFILPKVGVATSGILRQSRLHSSISYLGPMLVWPSFRAAFWGSAEEATVRDLTRALGR
jgi:pilus assembly protein CpaB